MPRQHLTILALVLAAAAFAAHSDDLRHGFLNLDDPLYIQASPITLQGLTWGGVGFAFTDVSHGATWVPLAKLSHMLDVQLWGLDPRGHHLTNVLLHAANAVLAFLAIYFLTASIPSPLRERVAASSSSPPGEGDGSTNKKSAIGAVIEIGRPSPSPGRGTGHPLPLPGEGRGEWPAFIVGALLAVHPVHVESVAWIAERRDVLSLFFALLTLLAYARYARVRSAPSYLLVLLGCAAAMMSKPMMVTLPAVLLLLDYWPLRRPMSWTLLEEKLIPLAMATAVAAITVKAQHHAIADLSFAPLSFRIANAPVFYARYLGMLVWPVDLSPFYPYPGLEPLGAILASAALLAAATIAAFLLRRRCPYLLVGWLWFLGTMFPVIGLAQSGPQAVACRFAYLPFVGLYIASAFLAAAAARRAPRITAPIAGLAVVVTLGLLTDRLSRQWRNNVTLFTYARNAAPENPLVDALLASALAEAQGPRWLEQATYLNLRSLWFDLHNGQVLLNQAALDLNDGSPDRIRRAASLVRLAVKYDPLNPNLPLVQEALKDAQAHSRHPASAP